MGKQVILQDETLEIKFPQKDKISGEELVKMIVEKGVDFAAQLIKEVDFQLDSPKFAVTMGVYFIREAEKYRDGGHYETPEDRADDWEDIENFIQPELL